MNKDKIQLISSKAILEYIDTINCDVQFTRDREVFNGRNLIAKQIKAEYDKNGEH